MKKIVFALLISISWVQHSYADWGDNYLLGKVGIMDVDLNSADPLLSFGALYGMGLTPEMSLELELNASMTGGDYTIETNAEEGDYSIWTGAIYGTYRFPFSQTVYAKVKLGGLYESIKRSSNLIPQTSNGFGAAGGFGVGVLAGKVLTLELELTSIDQDILFMTVGVHYRF